MTKGQQGQQLLLRSNLIFVNLNLIVPASLNVLKTSAKESFFQCWNAKLYLQQLKEKLKITEKYEEFPKQTEQVNDSRRKKQPENGVM